MTPGEISEKDITFHEHLKSESNEVVISGMVPRGGSCKEKAEVVNKPCTEEHMHFIYHNNINI